MGVPVLIYGRSGTGKSRSLKNFVEDEITLINVERKTLPFRKKFKYVINSDNYKKIKGALSKTPSDTIIIDDAGYLLTNTFMRGHGNRGSGASTYDLYNDIGDSFWKLFEFIKDLPDSKIVYIVMHEEENNSGGFELKMLGKLLKEKVCVEGMVTIAIRCMCEDGRHFFRVHTDGSDITKTPEEMFEKDEIDNDLKAVDTAIRAYYGLEKSGKTESSVRPTPSPVEPSSEPALYDDIRI